MLQKGRLDAAEKICRELLAARPNDADAIAMLQRVSVKRAEVECSGRLNVSALSAPPPWRRFRLLRAGALVASVTLAALVAALLLRNPTAVPQPAPSHVLPAGPHGKQWLERLDWARAITLVAVVGLFLLALHLGPAFVLFGRARQPWKRHAGTAAEDPQDVNVGGPEAQAERTVVMAAPSEAQLRESARRAEEAEREAGNATQLLWAAPAQGSELSLPKVRLTITDSADRALIYRSVEIRKPRFVIGRASDADLNLSDEALSRVQAIILWNKDGFTISDQSSNGTYLNGRRIQVDSAEPLMPGNVIRVGQTELAFISDQTDEMPDLAGRVVASRWRLARRLRTSAKASLYEAEDLQLANRVMVKILSPSFARFAGYLNQFAREARTAASLDHPFIAKMLGYGCETVDLSGKALKLPYVCMQLMQGGSLEDHLAKEKYIPVDKALSHLQTLTDALEHAHRLDIIHSGLKPSSVVFDSEGKAYVTDFAIASRAQEGGHSVLLGAPDFMAPEQFDGLAPTAQTDVYALAILTYLMVTGTRPFTRQSDPRERARNYSMGAPPAHEEADRQGHAGMSHAVSAVLKKGMAVSPGDRFASVREFFLSLKSAASGVPGAKPAVFLSYQHKPSAAWAALIKAKLEAKCYSTFVDTQQGGGAAQFPNVLRKAIEDSDIFVCLLARGTLNSTWVKEEVRIAFETGKLMIPIFQEDFVKPRTSKKLQPHVRALLDHKAIRLFDRQNAYVDTAIADLMRMIDASINGMAKGASM
jgi:pSer/pThr/pTyr-binding forkhead associated (FHA) protein